MTDTTDLCARRYSGYEIHRGLSIDNHKHLRELEYVLASDYAAQSSVIDALRKEIAFHQLEFRRQAGQLIDLHTERDALRKEREELQRRCVDYAQRGNMLSEANERVDALRGEVAQAKSLLSEAMQLLNSTKKHFYAAAAGPVFADKVWTARLDALRALQPRAPYTGASMTDSIDSPQPPLE